MSLEIKMNRTDSPRPSFGYPSEIVSEKAAALDGEGRAERSDCLDGAFCETAFTVTQIEKANDAEDVWLQKATCEFLIGS